MSIGMGIGFPGELEHLKEAFGLRVSCELLVELLNLLG